MYANVFPGESIESSCRVRRITCGWCLTCWVREPQPTCTAVDTRYPCVYVDITLSILHLLCVVNYSYIVLQSGSHTHARGGFWFSDSESFEWFVYILHSWCLLILSAVTLLKISLCVCRKPVISMRSKCSITWASCVRWTSRWGSLRCWKNSTTKTSWSSSPLRRRWDRRSLKTILS